MIMNFWKKYVVLVICALLAVAGVVTLNVQKSSHNTRIGAQNARILELENAITVKKAAIEAEQAKRNQDVTGMDATRKAHDDQIIEQMMTKVLTFSSRAEYMGNRSDIAKTYKFDEKSPMLKVAMPSVATTTGAGGKPINIIDTNKLVSSYDSMRSAVVGIKATTYQYNTIVVSSVKSANGKASVNRRILMDYTVDVDGNVVVRNITPISGELHTAG